MSSLRKPTLVIVHGGWHDPSCFDLVREPLESEGFKCHVPALPSIGELAASKTASDDVDLVHATIEGCLSQGEDVVVIGHSNGGLKANGALKGLVGHNALSKEGRGNIRGLALIAALLPPVANMGASKDKKPHLDSSRWTFSETEPTMLPQDPAYLFYNDMSPDQAAYWTSRIKPMHVQDMPSGYYEAWRHVPVSYLVCTKDNGISEFQQNAIIEAATAEGGVVHRTRVQSGHSPFLSVPEKVVEWVQRAVEEELI